jgi:hypothetical protein
MRWPHRCSEANTDTAFIDSPDIELTRTIFSYFADATPSGWIGRRLDRLMANSGGEKLCPRRRLSVLLFGFFALPCKVTRTSGYNKNSFRRGMRAVVETA